jgi:hypothetical protein
MAQSPRGYFEEIPGGPQKRSSHKNALLKRAKGYYFFVMDLGS